MNMFIFKAPDPKFKFKTGACHWYGLLLLSTFFSMLYDEYYLSYTIIPIVSTAKSPNSDQYRYCLEAFKILLYYLSPQGSNTGLVFLATVY